MSENIELAAGEFRPDYRWTVTGKYVLHFTATGNLVLRNEEAGRVIWESATSGAAKLAMQEDGNLVVYAEGDKPLWSSGTFGNPGSVLAVQVDGNLVIYSRERKPLWASGTRGL
jgi:outer membrane protein assembly factor BamB